MLFKNINQTGFILIVALLLVSCKEKKNEVKGSLDNLCINEICGETGKEWVELFNRSDVAIDISGVSILLNNSPLYTVPNKTVLPANGFKVLDKSDNTFAGDMPLDKTFVLSLVSPENDMIDIFDRNREFGVNKAHPVNASYARIPDGRSFWEITRTPTKGRENKNEDPNYEGLYINEVCAKEDKEWIELYNSTSSTMELGGITIVYDDKSKETILCKIPDNTIVHAEGYVVFDKSDGSLIRSFSMNKYLELSLISPKNAKIDVFNRDEELGVNQAHPTDGSYVRIPDGSANWEITKTPTKGYKNENNDTRTFEGLIINEVRATTGDEWIEAFNTTYSAMDISGVTIVYKNSQNQEQTLYKIPVNTVVNARAYIVFDKNNGISSGIFPMDKPIELSLFSPKNTVIDKFNRDQAIGVNTAHHQIGSYSRYPNASATWVATAIQTKNAVNRYATYGDLLSKVEKVGIWMRGDNFRDATAQTFQNMRDNYGIGQIVVNEAAMTVYNMTETAFKDKVNLAGTYGIKVHIWFQCFNSANLPVDPAKQQFNQEYFEKIITRAVKYVKFGNIVGIHLDYVRFPGVASANTAAYQHNYTPQFAEKAVADFCRQISEAVKNENQNVKISTAMKTEGADNIRLYGQNTALMAPYIDILMPMAYRYYFGTSAGDHGNSWISSTTMGFVDAAKKVNENCEVWGGVITYRMWNSDETDITALTASQIEQDCRAVFIHPGTGAITGATGVVLFRWGVGYYPYIPISFF